MPDEQAQKSEGKADSAKEIQEKLEKVEKEKEEYLGGWKRAKADFINFQKDEAKRFEEVVKFSNQDLILELIPVLDSFGLGIAALEKNGPVEKGIYIIRAQLEDVLKKRGVEKIGIKAGQPFDSAFMEAVATIESELTPGSVVEEVECGYLLNGKVIRPTRVRVAK